MTSFGVANKPIPKSDIYDFPAIPHILNIQEAKDNKRGVFIGLYNESQNKNIEGLLIVPPTPEDVTNDTTIIDASAIKYSGCNLELNLNNIIYNNQTLRKYNIDNTIIGLEKTSQTLYLLEEKTLEPLWSLPPQVFTLLKLGGSTTYGFSISNEKPILLKKKISNLVNTPPKNEIQEWKLVNDDEGSLMSEKKKNSKSTFVYVAGTSNDINLAIGESLESSYFLKYDAKYYLKDCQIFPRDEELHLVSTLKLDETNNKNVVAVLARMNKF